MVAQVEGSGSTGAMSSNHAALDPQLRAAQYGGGGHTATPSRSPLPPLSSLAAGPQQDGNRAVYTQSQGQQQQQPYYQYHTPLNHSSVEQRGGNHPPLSHSNDASPEDGESPSQAAEGAAGDDAKRTRACGACRNLKVRCDQDPDRPEVPCKRCAKAGRPCIPTQPTRKRQKKADSRVAELERKLDALTAALQTQQTGYNPPDSSQQHHRQSVPVPPAQRPSSGGTMASPTFTPPSHPAPPRSGSTSTVGGQKRKLADVDGLLETPSVDGAGVTVHSHLSRKLSSESGHPQTKAHFDGCSRPGEPDLQPYKSYSTLEKFRRRINEIVSPDVASTIFKRYTHDLCPHLPAVVFTPETTSDQIFRDKPILYVCILSSASSGLLPENTSRALTREAVGAIADNVVRRGAKSLELIQAMQVMALWYRPPEKTEATNFYQIIHMAAVMALDIGLGRRFNPAKARRGFGGPLANYAPGPNKILPQDSDTLEARRAWLCCYYLCASASMVLRRPNLVRWTNYMKECIEVLETHPDAFQSDRVFCQYVKIQHICEDVGLQFLMDDSTANISIKDPKVTYALNVLEGQLKQWKESIPADCRTKGLQFFEHVAELYLHEIALHFNHNIDDFRLPFTEESLKSVHNTTDVLTQNQMAALESCLKAAHGILDMMMSFEPSVIKDLPMLIFFVRCIYAIVILIKMHVAVCTPNSELGKMMKPEDLKVESYISNLMSLLGSLYYHDSGVGRPKPVRILGLLSDWFTQHCENVAAQQKGEQSASFKSKVPSQDIQTPLQLLSQVATGTQQAQLQARANNDAPSTNWTFDSPSVFDFPRKGNVNSTMNSTNNNNTNTLQPPQGQQQQQQPIDRSPRLVTADGYGWSSNDHALVDPTNLDIGWGSGFEQAMDLALGGTDGLNGTGLDNWFLGESVAPFGFPAEATGAQQQW